MQISFGKSAKEMIDPFQVTNKEIYQ